MTDDGNAGRLRYELLRTAEEVRIVDLHDRVFDTSRRLRRRRFSFLSVGSLLVVCALIAAGLRLLPQQPERPVQPPPTATATPTPVRTHAPSGAWRTIQHVVTPPTKQVGSREVTSLTFSDGTTTKLSYPASLRIAQLGAWPAGTAGNVEFSKYRLIGDAVDADGQRLQLWYHAGIDDYRLWLRKGSWFVAMGPDGGPVRRPKDIAKFHFRITADGFLVIHGPRKHRFNHETELGWHGVVMDMNNKAQTRELEIGLVRRCTTRVQRIPYHELGGWLICHKHLAIRIEASKDQQAWARGVRDTLRVESVRLAHG